jgi:site-specific DNA-methyltransferase (adenine-specific)
MKTETLWSKDSAEWETPQDLFDSLDTLYRFDLDVAATAENTKCNRFFTKDDDGLAQNWGGSRVWCNPPYGRQIAKWVQKAYEESRKPGTIVAMLLPARTDTAWFHDYAMKGKVQFLRGRVRFGGAENNAPFPSIIVIFGE